MNKPTLSIDVEARLRYSISVNDLPYAVQKAASLPRAELLDALYHAFYDSYSDIQHAGIKLDHDVPVPCGIEEVADYLVNNNGKVITKNTCSPAPNAKRRIGRTGTPPNAVTKGRNYTMDKNLVEKLLNDQSRYCSCGQEISSLPMRNWIGIQKDEDGKPFAHLINCHCGSTRAYPFGISAPPPKRGESSPHDLS